MAITTSAITSSFKNQLLEAKHNFDATGGDKFKLALYTDSSVIGPSLASFTTGGQVTDSTGDYASGGKVLQGLVRRREAEALLFEGRECHEV